MVSRLGLGKNNHLSYASLALNPRNAYREYKDQHAQHNQSAQCKLSEPINFAGERNDGQTVRTSLIKL